jgi:hypothetical protein
MKTTHQLATELLALPDVPLEAQIGNGFGSGSIVVTIPKLNIILATFHSDLVRKMDGPYPMHAITNSVRLDRSRLDR